jgi:hypothetical protein
MSFPRPAEEQASSGKAWFHMLFEPWLNGPTQQVASWFIHIAPVLKPAISTPEAIDAIIKEIETLAAGDKGLGKDVKTTIDAIFLGFHYLDHLHEPTLRLFPKDVPVIATPEAIAILGPWKYFTTILTIPSLSSNDMTWRNPSTHPGVPFPLWLTPLRIKGHHELNYLTALIWTHPAANRSETYELILQTPHSLKPNIPNPLLDHFLTLKPTITSKLALLHGLKESTSLATGQNTFGAKGGLSIYRKVGGVKYWVETHNAPLDYSGIVMKGLRVRDTERTVDWAVEEERNDGQGKGKEKPNVVSVGNGGVFILE